MFPRVKPLGWAFLEILTSTQMNQLDTNVSRSLDGVNGGAYTLAVLLELAGAGLKVSDVFKIDNATVDITNSTVNVNGTTWNFNDPVGFNALVGLLAGALVPSGQTLGMLSGSTFVNSVGATITNDGTLNNTGLIQNQSSGQIRRRWYDLPGSDATVSVNDGEVFLLPSGGSAHAYTLANTGSGDNTEVEFRQQQVHVSPSGHTVTYNAGGNVVTFGTSGVDNAIKILRLRRIPSSSFWQGWLERYGPN